jgi:hypothetical protein
MPVTTLLENVADVSGLEPHTEEFADAYGFAVLKLITVFVLMRVRVASAAFRRLSHVEQATEFLALYKRIATTTMATLILPEGAEFFLLFALFPLRSSLLMSKLFLEGGLALYAPAMAGLLNCFPR